MRKTFDSSRKRVVLLGMVCLAAVACTPKNGELGDEYLPHGKWEQVQPTPKNMVEVVTLGHMVSFPHGEAGLDLAARDDITRFIQTNRIGQNDRIAVQAPAAEGSQLAHARLTSVKAEFARRGLVAAETQDSGNAGMGLEPAAGQVAVLVTRAVVVAPDCSQPQPEPVMRPEIAWGCTVETALGMMVADPMDLVEGRDLGPADGEQASGALRRYRADAIKPLITTEGSD
jgi:pilus assembly protein CpaD